MLYPEPKTRVCQSAFGSTVFSLLISSFILHSSSSHLTGLEVVGSNTLRAKVWKCGLFWGSTVVCGWKKNRQQLPFSWVREEISNLDMCSKRPNFPSGYWYNLPGKSQNFPFWVFLINFSQLSEKVSLVLIININLHFLFVIQTTKLLNLYFMKALT